MEFHLEVKYSDSFVEVIAQGLKIEKALIKKGLVKIYKDCPRPTYNNDKPKFWSKNKNIVNDGIVDARIFKIAQPMIKIVKRVDNRNNNNPNPNKNNTNQGNPPNNQGNQAPNTQQEAPMRKYSTYKLNQTYTPLGESLEMVLR